MPSDIPSAAELSKLPRVVQAWHWLAEPNKLRDGTPVRVGRLYRLKGGQEPIICYQGFHASIKLLDALNYAPGLWLCRVELTGKFSKEEHRDKLCASERRILWMLDAKPILRSFLCDLAEERLKQEAEQGQEHDEDIVNAVKVARDWLAGKATDRDLRIAQILAEDALERLNRLPGSGSTEYQYVSLLGSRLAYAASRKDVGSALKDMLHILEVSGRYDASSPYNTATLNAALEAKFFAVAPKEQRAFDRKKRWDKSQKLRKPLCAKSELAKALAPRNEDLVESLAQRWVRWQQAEEKLRRAKDEASWKKGELARQAERLVQSQVYNEPIKPATFTRRLNKLVTETREAHCVWQQATIRWQRFYEFERTHLQMPLDALTPKQRKDVQARSKELWEAAKNKKSA